MEADFEILLAREPLHQQLRNQYSRLKPEQRYS
jgi:hypothetical protein